MTGNPLSRRRHKYTKVLDSRKQPIRHLYRRNGGFYARITIEDEQGRKRLAWIPLRAETPAQAQEQLRRVLVERADDELRHVGQSPSLEDYYRATYLGMLRSAGKKEATVVTENGHLQYWIRGLGHLRLNKILPSHVQTVLGQLRETLQPRTCNGALCALNNLLRAAKTDGFLKALPTRDIARFKTEQKQRRLFTRAEIERVCEEALGASKNGQQLADYIRFLTFSGAREAEALRIRWEDVDLENRRLCIGADGDTKNRSARWLDMSAELHRHLSGMFARRAPDSRWLFPSPRRGEVDRPAESFRESRKLARAAAGLPDFGFHDCRHYFISHAVMSGLDYMTIAKWVGHKDGGLLIGKVYGHLSDSHTRHQATRLSFK
jgi:integrase